MGRLRGLGRVLARRHHHRDGELTLERLLAAARAHQLPAVVLIAGDAALAAPLAERLASAIGAAWGVTPQDEKFLDKLAPAIDDLRTVALFASGKLLVVHGTGLLADREEAVRLMKPVLEAAKAFSDPSELDGASRESAVRLLRILRLHDLDPTAGTAEQVVARLPAELLGESPAENRARLTRLLDAALAAGLHGYGADDATLLADLLRDGVPERHLLILVESSVDARHPLVKALAKRGAVLEAGRLEIQKGGVAGLAALVDELERETGARIRGDAAKELSRRTMRGDEEARREGRQGAVDADSAARFAAEYRKLAALAGGVIDSALVATNVADRGEEDVWELLDDVARGQAGAALAKLDRRLRGAEDPVLERLSIFGRLAAFTRDVVAAGSAVAGAGIKAGQKDLDYKGKQRLASQLIAAVEGIDSNPLSGRHPNFVYRAYQAAPRFSQEELARLPALILETERRLKGDSGDPDAALAAFVVTLAKPAGGAVSSVPAGGAGSRARGAGGGRS